MTMLREISLEGSLSKFGGPYHLEVASVGEAVKALCNQLQGLAQALRDGEFRVIIDFREEEAIDESLILFKLGKAKRIRIVSVPNGSKKGGLGKVILGIVLVVATIYTGGAAAGTLMQPGMGLATFGEAMGGTAFSILGMEVSFSQLALMGVSMALQGLSQMMAPSPKVDNFSKAEGAESRPSFTLTGPTNTVEQGHPVPIVFGIVRTGSAVVSSGITTEAI